MKLHYMKKFNGDLDSLPKREHAPGAVQYKEPEDMSKARFIFMSMLPNLVFGFIPFAMFLMKPSWVFWGTLGALAIPAGAGDYMNVFNTIRQVPKGAKVYMNGMHTYWYLPENDV